MVRPALRYAQRGGMLALFGQPQPRDHYTGTTPPAVAAPRDPADVLSVRSTGRTALVLVRDHGHVRLLTITSSDSPELSILSASDRAMVASAVASLHRQTGVDHAA